MMQKLFHDVHWFGMQRIFPTRHCHDLYIEWDKPARQTQIFAITGVTALLYVIFTILNKSWVSEPVYALMLKIHLLIIIPILLAISILAYKKRFYTQVMYLLAIHPVVSMSCHAYIASQMENSTPFLTEGYLGIFWTFIVSGLTFRFALASGVMSTLILLISASYFIEDQEAYVMHAFWLFCSFSFGCVGAFLYDRSRTADFISQQALERLAIIDPLTGVYNRSQLTGSLSQEIERARRYNKTFGFMVIDIDYFKLVNDEFGHDKGDEVLKQVAQTLTESIRETDTLIRWGGEEFVVIALEADEQNFIYLSNKLREQVEAGSYGGVGTITVSIGATLFREEDNQGSLFCRTDKALYKAKQQGRNTTVYV